MGKYTLMNNNKNIIIKNTSEEFFKKNLKDIKQNHQLLRIDGLNCFVEVLDSMVYLNSPKFIINFIKYDPNAKAGSKFLDQIPIYIDYDKADALSSMILSGTLARIKLKASKEGQKELYRIMGGTLYNPNSKNARADKKDESRQFIIELGVKKAFGLIAMSGPGKKDDKGLIVPQYKQNEAEHKVIMGFSDEEMILFARAIQRKVQAMDLLNESIYQKQIKIMEKLKNEK